MPETLPEVPPHPTVRPAATAVIFRRAAAGGPPELLMVQRSDGMRFAGGMAVFPGGRIDDADRELAARIAPAPLCPADPEQAAARIAAIRETLEETGLLIGLAAAVSAADARAAREMLVAGGALAPVLAHFGWTLALDALVPFARWCPNWERAFDTRFFLADLGTGQVELEIDGSENSRLFWVTARDALAMDDAGEISVIFPTRRNLDRLAQYDAWEAAVADARAHPVRIVTPYQEQRDGEVHLCIPEGRGYPVTSQTLSSAKRG